MVSLDTSIQGVNSLNSWFWTHDTSLLHCVIQSRHTSSTSWQPWALTGDYCVSAVDCSVCTACVTPSALTETWWLHYYGKQKPVGVSCVTPQHVSIQLVYFGFVVCWKVWVLKLTFKLMTWISFSKNGYIEFQLGIKTVSSTLVSFWTTYLFMQRSVHTTYQF